MLIRLRQIFLQFQGESSWISNYPGWRRHEYRIHWIPMAYVRPNSNRVAAAILMAAIPQLPGLHSIRSTGRKTQQAVPLPKIQDGLCTRNRTMGTLIPICDRIPTSRRTKADTQQTSEEAGTIFVRPQTRRTRMGWDVAMEPKVISTVADRKRPATLRRNRPAPGPGNPESL